MTRGSLTNDLAKTFSHNLIILTKNTQKSFTNIVGLSIIVDLVLKVRR